MARVRRNARAGRWRKHRRRQAILHARRTAAPQRTSGGPRRFRPASPRSIYCPVLPCCRGHDLIDQNRDRMGAVKTKHRAAKGLQPGFVTRQAAALAGAVVIVRGPLEEVIGFIVPATSLFSITQPRKADFGWRKQEHRKVEQSEDRVAPRVERTARVPRMAAAGTARASGAAGRVWRAYPDRVDPSVASSSHPYRGVAGRVRRPARAQVW